MVSKKLWTNFDLENIQSFSISTSKCRARVAKGRPSFRDRITEGEPRVQNCVSKGRCRFRKNRKFIFGSLGNMKRGENWFPKNSEQIMTWKIFGPNHSQYVPLRAELPLPSSCCKGEACLPRLHYKGIPRVQNFVSRGRCRLRKTENIFSAYNDMVTWNVEKSGFQKLWKPFDLEYFQSESFSIRTSKGRAPASKLLLQRGGLPSEIALQGDTSSSKFCIEGSVQTSKNRKYIFGLQWQGNMKRGEMWFPKNYEQILTYSPYDYPQKSM